MQKRYLEVPINHDLKEKMVFLGGPRQVGKTSLSFNLLGGNEKHPAYLNWDIAKTRKMLVNGELPPDEAFIILDEIHKYRYWRNLVKGFYDANKSTHQFLVTGSARLDYYRRGGDSLQGRYHYFRLHPLSLMELIQKPTHDDTEHLLNFGGFPEPFFKGNKTHLKRWQNERLTRVMQEDLVNLEHVRELSQMQFLADLLPEKVGSPLSINSLREDLQVAFESVERWVTILENLYFCFRILPYGPKKIRAARKEKKLYLWDWTLCENSGARFENMVASYLLKYCHYHEDVFGEKMELKFLRDVYKREIDFVVIKNKKPLFAVECKTGERNLSPAIEYFLTRTDIPYFYQVHLGSKDAIKSGKPIRILPFEKLCVELGV